jgi:hypothetical protein
MDDRDAARKERCDRMFDGIDWEVLKAAQRELEELRGRVRLEVEDGHKGGSFVDFVDVVFLLERLAADPFGVFSLPHFVEWEKRRERQEAAS